MRGLTLFFIAVSLVFSHGKTGHRIVGKIAEDHLSAKAKEEITKLLGHTNLARVSTWADEIRSDKNWKHADTWHYVTIPSGMKYENRIKEPKGDVVQKILEFETLLGSSEASKDDKEVALKFLVHFISDIHQPLHVGKRGDKGGNDVDVKWFWKKSNLHRVWDSGLIDDEDYSYTEYADVLQLKLKPKAVGMWQNSNVLDWTYESMGYRDQVYDIDNGELSYQYVYKNKSLSELRLLQAGIRLAGMLNNIFDK